MPWSLLRAFSTENNKPSITGIKAGINKLHYYIGIPSNKAVLLHRHTHPFNGLLSGTTRVGRYQKGKTNLDFTEARDSHDEEHNDIVTRSTATAQKA